LKALAKASASSSVVSSAQFPVPSKLALPLSVPPKASLPVSVLLASL
jgi:hypothetical protein